MARKPTLLPPIHPGEILREEFLVPFGLSINELARQLSIPVTRVSEIVNERRGITADTALRLSRYFGMTPEFWINLQTAYELEVAERSSGDEIYQRIRPRNAA
jgi:addiction module HigA family antidote